MSKKIALLGSTGSIGRQSAEIIRSLGYTVTALSAHSNVGLLEQQIVAFKPKYVAVADEKAAGILRRALEGSAHKPEIHSGSDAARQVTQMADADIVLNAIVGIAGLAATLAALERGLTVALANKESLVAGGALVMKTLEKGGRILPVDSEHSAIFQCLQDPNNVKSLRRILLTASGGPFYGFDKERLLRVSNRDAMHHPNWDMGPKITVDSSTMMNKGLELIEAMWLFGVREDQVEIVVQQESIIHSMVEFDDRSILAQIGNPDMRIPIQYALTWPQRLESPVNPLDFSRIASLNFGRPDYETFECLAACRLAAQKGGLAPCAANGANEEAVQLFFEDKIRFLDIGRLVKGCVEADSYAAGSYDLQDIYTCDAGARRYVREHA